MTKEGINNVYNTIICVRESNTVKTIVIFWELSVAKLFPVMNIICVVCDLIIISTI